MEGKWIKTTERLPTKRSQNNEFCGVSHVDCFILINGRIEERPYNFDRNCWDNQDYDDFEYEATEPSDWMYCGPWKLAPEDQPE